jgi:hypothetical protein
MNSRVVRRVATGNATCFLFVPNAADTVRNPAGFVLSDQGQGGFDLPDDALEIHANQIVGREPAGNFHEPGGGVIGQGQHPRSTGLGALETLASEP